MRTLVKQAEVVFPDRTIVSNVLFDENSILDSDAPTNARADEVIDGTGLFLLPGLIDDQVHFRDPGLSHKEDLSTGSKACAKGGITTFLEMPNTKPTTTTQQRLEEKLKLASEKCLVNYGFYIGATPHNLEELKQAHRTPGIKIFIGSSTGDLLVDDQESLEAIFAETTLPICAHCEDEATVRANQKKLQGGTRWQDHSEIRDHQAALIATQRAVDLAIRHQHQFHVLHVSTKEEVDFLNRLNEKPDRNGNPILNGLVSAEACPHHLFFSVEDYDRLGSLVQMNPSIKTKADNEALWHALREGIIDVVATDHAPHTWEEKQQPYPLSPSGLPAVENSLALMLNASEQREYTLQQIVHWMAEAPARIWNIKGKGRIEDGFDSDLILVDLHKTQTIANDTQVTKCGWSPWEGESLKGWTVRTWVNGRTVFHKGKFDESVRGREALFDRN